MVDGSLDDRDAGKIRQVHCLSRTAAEREETENLRKSDVNALTFDAINDTVQDENMHIVRVNKKARQFFQAQEADLNGRYCHEIFSGNSEQCPGCLIRTSLGNEEVSSAVIEYEEPGKILQLTSSIIPSSIGSERYLVHVARNITHPREMEKALWESEERFSKAFGSNPAPMAISDIKTGLFIDVNKKWLEMLGYSKEELIGQTSVAKGIWENPKERERMLAEFSSKGSIQEFPVTYRTKSGETRSVLRSAEKITLDGREVMLSLIYDFTERQKAERTLTESREKFALAFDASPDAVNINRLEDGMYVEINRGFTELTGYTLDDVYGKTSSDIDIWNEPADKFQLIKALRETGYCENLEAQFRRKDGSLTTGLMSARTISLNNAPHIISITRDISQRKKVEAERIQLESQLHQAQKMESVGRLTGGVAHDFNNILGVIIGYSELALMKTGSIPDLHDDLKKILDAARRSADIVRQLLAFSRQQVIHPVALDLNSTIEEMLKILQRLIGEDIELAWIAQADLSSIRMDPTQMNQILANLCINARDAIKGTGRITIETEMVEMDGQYCADHVGFLPGKFVRLAVSDTGCGIDHEDQAKIFEPFFTTKELGHGTGLGLSTVYGIVKQNQGFINVYSEPGKGTTFKLYFPPCMVKGSILERTVGRNIQRGNGETILLVEDDPVLLATASKMLKNLGYHVLKADTPGEACNLAEQYPGSIHLLLTDVIMPEMNGKDLAHHLQTRSSKLKCLFTSGYTASVVEQSGVLDKDIHFIQKPYSIYDLGSKILEVLHEEKKQPLIGDLIL